MEKDWQIVGTLEFTKSKKGIRVKVGKAYIGVISMKSLVDLIEGKRERVYIMEPPKEEAKHE